MGKATRWFKGLFGIKPYSSGDPQRRRSSRETAGGLCENHATIPPNISEREAAWLRSFYAEGEAERERRTHAIAVAAATAAAADAAVAAAKAAAAVVRLTGKSGPLGGSSREKGAALKIQCTFRGYLARKALRALRGVVKIQALVRGYLVRKKAAATLRSMEALVRAQATVKFHRALRRPSYIAPPRKSMERFSGSLENRNNGEETAKIVEVDTWARPGTHRARRNVSYGSDLIDDPFRRTNSSPLSGRIPPRLSMPKPDWDECSSKFPTAQSTPRFTGGSPSKGSCFSGDTRADADLQSFFSGDFYPSYMADTTSFRAKLRSQSAPKQRPDATVGGGGWRRSIGGVRVHRPSCSGVREAFGCRDAVVGNIYRL